MILLKQSTAYTWKAGPFVDDTDGKTAKTSLSIAQADIKISKNGGSYAQSHNSAGATHDTLGEYSVPLDTTDTNTLGTMKVLIFKSGALPVWETFMVVPANVYNSLVLGSAYLDVNTKQVGGTTQTARDLGASVLLSSGTGTGQISLSSGAVTVGTNNDKTGYSLSAAGINAIWDQLLTAITTVGSIGKLIKDYLDAAVSTRSTFSGGAVASVTDPVIVGTNNDKTGYALTAAYDAAKTAAPESGGNIAAIKAKTDMLPVVWYSP